jgi:hypothetical protein
MVSHHLLQLPSFRDLDQLHHNIITFGLRKMLGNSWVTAQLAASQGGHLFHYASISGKLFMWAKYCIQGFLHSSSYFDCYGDNGLRSTARDMSQENMWLTCFKQTHWT